MFRKSHILCFLLGICLILANAQEEPQETIVKEENELPLLLEGEEQIAEDVTTLAPDEELLLEDEFLEGEEGLEGEDYIDEEGLDEEIVDEELIDLCTYNPDSKGEVEITYEVISETDNKVLEIIPAVEEDPNKVLNDCLSLQDIESRSKEAKVNIYSDRKARKYRQILILLRSREGKANIYSDLKGKEAKRSRRRNQMLKRRRKIAKRRRRKNPRRNRNRARRRQQLIKRRRNQQRLRAQKRRRAQQKKRRKANKRKQNQSYEAQVLSQIRKLLKEIASDPESLNKVIKLSQNLLLRAVGETPQDVLQEEAKTNIP
ncbi:hypothetical protein Anas_03029, partial [Armadillidium nasatum]